MLMAVAVAVVVWRNKYNRKPSEAIEVEPIVESDIEYPTGTISYKRPYTEKFLLLQRMRSSIST